MKVERKLDGFPFVDKRRRLAACKNSPEVTIIDGGNPDTYLCTCPAGTYRKHETVGSDQGLSCVTCPPGTFESSAGTHDDCENCTAGHYPNAAKTNCDTCDPGTFAPTQASSNCEDCPRGYSQHGSGSQVCTACAKGHASNVTKNANIDCDSCKPGRYSDVLGLSVCKACEPGNSMPHNLSLIHI